jgi:hypothetical protein
MQIAAQKSPFTLPMWLPGTHHAPAGQFIGLNGSPEHSATCWVQ